MPELEVKVLEDKENPYLDRREIKLEIRHEGRATPSRREIAEIVRERLGLDPEKALLMYIKTETGMNKSTALIYYYPNGIKWSQIEPPNRKKVLTQTQQKQT
jgi:small subunit ribosomal protein S24e